MKQFIYLTTMYIFLASGSTALAQISANESLVLLQSVIANGGGESTGGEFSVYGTPGQSIAGVHSSGPARTVHGGFWNGIPLAATSAHVEISGRVTAADGRPIANATITLNEATGTSHVARTNQFGWYRFFEVEVGQTVFVTVQAKRFTFTEPTRTLSVADNFDDLNFVASETH